MLRCDRKMIWFRIYSSNFVRRYILCTTTNVTRAINFKSSTLAAPSNVLLNQYHENFLTTIKSCQNSGHILMFSNQSSTDEIDSATYESVCSETLDSLCEFFEDVIEKTPILKKADVSFGDGVLTVNLDTYGIYVINRQSPNKQIWLSSPISGPKRYDFVPSRKGWVYRHDNKTLHGLLKEELSSIVKSPIDLSNCAYCGDFK